MVTVSSFLSFSSSEFPQLRALSSISLCLPDLHEPFLSQVVVREHITCEYIQQTAEALVKKDIQIFADGRSWFD